MITVCLANVRWEHTRAFVAWTATVLAGRLWFGGLCFGFQRPGQPHPWVKEVQALLDSPEVGPVPPHVPRRSVPPIGSSGMRRRWEINNNWNPYLIFFLWAKAC